MERSYGMFYLSRQTVGVGGQSGGLGRDRCNAHMLHYNHLENSILREKTTVLQSNPAILCAEFVVFQNVWLEFFFSFFRLKHAQSELKKKQSELKNTEKSYKKDKDVYDAIEKSKTKLEVSEMSDDLLLCRLLSSFVALFLEISM